jgi:hypothetical protein
MRASTSQLPSVLRGAFDVTYSCDVFVEGARVMHNVPVVNPTINEDATALVQATGSLTIVYQDPTGKSLSPVVIGDTFSPFGTQITLSANVTAGAGFSETILLGTFLIDDTPTIDTKWSIFNGATISQGDRITVTFADLMARTQKNTFDTPGSPPQLLSGWTEIQRLTQLPITRSMADKAIPGTVAYQEDRLQAVYDIASTAFDAVACMTSDATVSLRPKTWPAVMDSIVGGDGGTLIGAPRAMSNKDVYNKLVVKDSAGNVLAQDQIRTGPLRAANPDGSLSPYGTVTKTVSFPQITTATQAAAYIAQNLPRMSTLRGQQVTVTEVFNPLRELGDVVSVARKVRGATVESFTGRVMQLTRTGAKTQQVQLAVGQ